MKKEVIENWIQEAYGIAKAHGFHDVERKDGHWLMLITTEIAEAVEADRKGLVADYDAFLFCSKHRKTVYDACGQDSPLGRQYQHEVLFERYIKNTIEDELADICIRCCDYLGCRILHSLNCRSVSRALQICFMTPSPKRAGNGCES